MMRRMWQCCMFLLIACYALQTCSPLRLDADAVALLSMADSAAHGGGFVDQGHRTVFPPGYPALIAVLSRSGLGYSSAIIGMNLLLLLGGLFFAYRILRERFFQNKMTSLYVCSLSLFSYVVIKHFTMPLSDIAFFGIAMCSLAVMDHASTLKGGKHFVALVLAGWGLVVVSITIRRIGVALIPALVYVVISSPESKLFLKGILLVAGVLGTILVVSATSTIRDFTTVAGKSTLPKMLFQNSAYRLGELGEIAINAPTSRLPAAARVVVPWMGLAAWSVILCGLLIKRQNPGTIEVFFGSYLCVLLAWPYYNARFWLPVVPLLIGYAGLAIRRVIDRTPVAAAAAIYCSAFVLTGAVALAFSTRITFAGSKFPDVYGDGTLRPSYCAAFQTCSEAYSADEVDPQVAKLLRTYR